MWKGNGGIAMYSILEKEGANWSVLITENENTCSQVENDDYLDGDIPQHVHSLKYQVKYQKYILHLVKYEKN